MCVTYMYMYRTVYRKSFTYNMNTCIDVVTTLTLASTTVSNLLSAYYLFSHHLRILQLTTHDFSAPTSVN
jgi:hypothetical protein